MEETVYIDHESGKVLIVSSQTLTPEGEPVCTEMTIDEYNKWLSDQDLYK